MPRILLTRDQKLANRREYNRRWAEANPGKVKASREKFEAANKEKIAAYKAAARKADPDKFKRRKNDWEKRNPEKIRASSLRNYYRHRESALKRIKAWQEKNAERVEEYRRERAGRPEVLAAWRSYANARYRENTQARLATLLRNRLWKAIKRGTKSESAIAALGCPVDQAVMHIASQFSDGMTWANHGAWHIDHKRPLASFDLTDPEQFRKACHFTNLQPMWARENQSKGASYQAKA